MKLFGNRKLSKQKQFSMWFPASIFFLSVFALSVSIAWADASVAVTTMDPLTVSVTSATLQGDLTDIGAVAIVKQGFSNYVDENSCTLDTNGSLGTKIYRSALPSAGFQTGEYNIQLTGLGENMPYWYRAYIEDNDGYVTVGDCVSYNTIVAPAPVIKTFTSTPTSVPYNSAAGFTLAWTTEYADSCLADWKPNNAVSGSQVLTAILSTTTYTLNCSGVGGTTSRALEVTVDLPTISVTLDGFDLVENGGLLATANVVSNAVGNVNYNFWWDCDPIKFDSDQDQNSIEVTNSVCGNFTTNSALGMYASSGLTSYSPSHTYPIEGTYNLKVIVTRDNSAPAAVTKAIEIIKGSQSYSDTSDSRSAQPGKLPSIMVGESKITVGSGATASTWYGGLQGNYLVYNYGAPYDFGFKSRILNCTDDNGMIAVLGACFILNPVPSQGIRLMHSETTAIVGTKSKIVYQLPVLLRGRGMVVGDTFGVDTTKMGEFEYWGKNLAQSAGQVDAAKGSTWNLGSYTMNTEAQSYWSGDSPEASTENDQYKQYAANIQTLIRSGTNITPAKLLSCTGQLYLQGSDICAPLPSDADKYPEGKVWVVKEDITLNKSFVYTGKGTLIVVGANLLVDPNITLLPATEDPSNKLGIIVLDK